MAQQLQQIGRCRQVALCDIQPELSPAATRQGERHQREQDEGANMAIHAPLHFVPPLRRCDSTSNRTVPNRCVQNGLIRTSVVRERPHTWETRFDYAQ